jgi:hypothetical protein
MTSADALVLIREIKKLGYKPNDWEKQFLGNALGHKKISNKQGKILETIYAKAAGGGVYQSKEKRAG